MRVADGMAKVLLLLLVAVPCSTRLTERDFSMLVHRFRQGSSQLSDEHLHLLYEQVNNIVWTASESASALANVTYNVVLYDVPPFVRLNDVEGLLAKRATHWLQERCTAEL